MLLMDVSATLGPVRCRHSPKRSCQDRGGAVSLGGRVKGRLGNLGHRGGTNRGGTAAMQQLMCVEHRARACTLV